VPDLFNGFTFVGAGNNTSRDKSWDDNDSTYQYEESRILTLKEVGIRIGVDVNVLGNYKDEDDAFV
jgi:hypothetical protein